MLERYFAKPDTIDAIRASWIGEPIGWYVAWLAEQGYSVRTITRRVPILMQFGTFARDRGATCWSELPSHVEAFVQHWVKAHAKNAWQATQWVGNDARTPTEQLLSLIVPGFHGRGRRRTCREPFLEQAPGFFVYLREERGLRERSIWHYGHYLRSLEAYLARINVSCLAELTPAVLSAFVVESGRRLSPHSMTGLCSTLRVFLRYLHREQLISRDLGATVESPRRYQLADVPRSISWDDVRRMLGVVDRRTALGKRDYAILLLLITYGLRGYEVAGLTLEHIDWKRERLLVPQRKAGHTTAYPLSALVGEAILDYLQSARPSTEQRQLFFRVLAPVCPVTPVTVANRATHYLRKAGIRVRRPGSHTLRHTCVQRLVDAEFNFKVIGDYVGHASPSSTRIYSKVDVETLREVALGHEEVLP
ncbi:tyrosine-type recombinase/integrase [Aquisalimonas sp.]|uniref:tyrosine-type recombinase/integrase n=1 Tax=Aquisalimonas sp. TaxID=1872621 RepID=UPI0025BC67DE|nr:tyrosine-type recombinase/integrase [Aquisalimonas sp.]